MRPRRGWEAVDLGFAMVRAWGSGVYRPWLLVVVPVWALALAGLYRWPAVAYGVLWWLRPLFDRVILFALDRCFAGRPPRVGETLRALPGLLSWDLPGALLLRRLDPARSFHLPLRQLEGLRGPEVRRRVHWLRGGEGPGLGFGLTAGCWLIERGTILAFAALLAMILPGAEPPERVFSWAFAGGPAGWVILAAAFFLVEPLYVAGGFSLYLSRRTWAEGLDVEAAFRRMAARLEARARGGRRAAALPLWLLLGTGLFASGLALPAAALAASGSTPGQEREAPRRTAPVPAQTAARETPERAVREVLRDEDFQTHKRITRWLPRQGLLSFDPPSMPSLPWPVLAWVVMAVRWVLLAVAALLALALLAWLGRAWWRWLVARREREAREPSQEPPAAVSGRDSEEPLPDDLPAAAWALWERGEAAAALGLLYRGALAVLTRGTTCRSPGAGPRGSACARSAANWAVSAATTSPA